MLGISYHQHDPALVLDEHFRVPEDYCVYLLGSHRLAILAEMETLTVYHVGNLLGAHPSAGGCKAIDYGFFNLYLSNVDIFDIKSHRGTTLCSSMAHSHRRLAT